MGRETINHKLYMGGRLLKIFPFIALFLSLLVYLPKVSGQEESKPLNVPPVTNPAKAKPRKVATSTNQAQTADKVVLPELTNIPAGSFNMGSKRKNESPVHKVELKSFAIGKYEISNKEFDAFTKATNYLTDAEQNNEEITWRSYYLEERDYYPVVHVTWHDSVMYCKWLSEVTKENFRLPTEAEWEYAARGQLEGKLYPWGDDLGLNHANYDENDEHSSFSGLALDFIKPVGSYSFNGYKLFDMVGNVWEWCQDWYGEKYFEVSVTSNPLGPETGEDKVMRGGGWNVTGDLCRITIRQYNTIGFHAPFLGFRVVKQLE